MALTADALDPFRSRLIRALAAATEQDNSRVYDSALKLLTYAMETAGSDEAVAMLESEQCVVFDNLMYMMGMEPIDPDVADQLQLLVPVETLIIILQYLNQSLAVYWPTSREVALAELLTNLRLNIDRVDLPNNARTIVANLAARVRHILSSTGLAIGILAINKDAMATRRQRQLTVRRVCEGCGRREDQFG